MQMKMRLSSIITLILLSILLPFQTMEAANDYSEQNRTDIHHVIICFDQLVDPYSNYLKFDIGIKGALKKVLFYKDSLLREGDYYSILTYEEGNLDCTLTNFAQPSKRNSIELVWQPYKGFGEMLSGSWSDIANGHSDVLGQAYSLQTAAKSYCLARVRNDEKFANRTFLIMITDDAYNGNDDYNKEFYSMIDVSGARMYDRDKFDKLEALFIANCHRIASFYRFDYLPQYMAVIDDHGRNKYKVMVFEASPTSTFSLASVVDFPANLGLKRVRGGYMLDFNYQTTDSIYQINKFNVSIVNRQGDVVEKCSKEKGDSHVSVKLYSNEVNNDFVEVSIAGWLRQMDGIYNGLEMSPSSYSRLKTTLKLPLKAESKILGIVPLYDFMWWWFPNDIMTAVSIWNVVFILAFIGLIYWLIRLFIRRNAIYEPDNSEISMKKI